MDTETQIVAICATLAIAVWFLVSARRHGRAQAALDEFMTEFDALCEDDTVNVDLLENIQKVFAISCRMCGAWTVMGIILLYRLNKRSRTRMDNVTLLATKRLRPDTARKIVRSYGTLFIYASYAFPILGVFIRHLIRRTGLHAEKTLKPAVFMVAAHRLAA